MCDSVFIRNQSDFFFAKNTDRDPNEPQLLEWHPRAQHTAKTLRVSHMDIDQVAQTNAMFISKPFWGYGAEMGVNEHGVSIGNHSLWLKDKVAKQGLTGMDLLRLALERASTAKQAAETIVELATRYGQGGACSFFNAGFRYYSSFLLADPKQCFYLETGPQSFELREVKHNEACSNLPLFEQYEARKDPIYTYFAGSESRRKTLLHKMKLQNKSFDVLSVIELLSAHANQQAQPEFSPSVGALTSPCMHGGGPFSGCQTTGSLITHYRDGGFKLYATGTSLPCQSLFKPIELKTPIELGNQLAKSVFSPGNMWWEWERLHRRMANWGPQLRAQYQEARQNLQPKLLTLNSQAAFDETQTFYQHWSQKSGKYQALPFMARLSWNRFNRAAKLL